MKDEHTYTDDFTAMLCDFQGGIEQLQRRRDAMTHTQAFISGLPGLKADVMTLPGQMMLIAVDLSVGDSPATPVMPADVENMPPKMLDLIDRHFCAPVEAAPITPVLQSTASLASGNLAGQLDGGSLEYLPAVIAVGGVESWEAADPPARVDEVPSQECVSGPLSVAEKARVRELMGQGSDARTIAADLGRRVPGIASVVKRFAREDRAGSGRKVSAAPSAAAQAAVAPVESAAAATDVPDREPQSASILEVGVRLDALGNDDYWTPKVDLSLVMALVSGTSAKAVAKSWGIELSAVRDRWRALICEGTPTPDGQKRLIAALRARVERFA